MYVLIFICLLPTKSFAQLNYNSYLPFYDSLGIPTYMKVTDTSKFFCHTRTGKGSKIEMVDENNKIVGYYILENKNKWVFRKRTL